MKDVEGQSQRFLAGDEGTNTAIEGKPLPKATTEESDDGISKKKPKVEKEEKKTTKVQRRKWKKPNDAPKRPLSAYNLFFQHERQKIVLKAIKEDKSLTKKQIEIALTNGKRPHRKSHGKISFRDLARSIGAKWKALPDEEKSVYIKEASVEKERYKTEVENYKKDKKRKEAEANICHTEKPGEKLPAQEFDLKGKEKNGLSGFDDSLKLLNPQGNQNSLLAQFQAVHGGLLNAGLVGFASGNAAAPNCNSTIVPGSNNGEGNQLPLWPKQQGTANAFLNPGGSTPNNLTAMMQQIHHKLQHMQHQQGQQQPGQQVIGTAHINSAACEMINNASEESTGSGWNNLNGGSNALNDLMMLLSNNSNNQNQSNAAAIQQLPHQSLANNAAAVAAAHQGGYKQNAPTVLNGIDGLATELDEECYDMLSGFRGRLG